MIVSGVFALPFDDSAGFTAPPAFGPFRVLHQIGSGVLGPVFRTFDPQREKLVAVKVFRLDVVPEVSARLAEALRRMAATPVQHPAVVPVVDAGLEGTTAFLASEYVAAETLDVSLRTLAPARIETALPLLRQVAEGLEAAWSAGAGHGALHPRDIFVVANTREVVPGRSSIRVAGFGVVAALDALKIAAPVRRPYTAPEREDGGAWDIRADVYSLGVIAHELLTGRRPAGQLEQDGELPAGTSPNQRVAIRRALSGALVADPARRFATPTAFVDALTSGELPEEVAEAPVVPAFAEPPVPEPEPELEPEMASEHDVAPVSDWPPDPMSKPFSAVQPEPDRSGRFQPRYIGGIETSPHLDPPQETSDMPRLMGFAALLVLALVVGTGFGYWLRGRADAPTADVAAPSGDVTKVPADEPIGTEVPVNEPVKTKPATTPVAPPAAPGATPVAEPAPTRGRLLVRSVPSGAMVVLNGRERGTTPATIRDLPFGTYTVAVSRSGYQRREQRVVVSTTVPAREITVELTPMAPAAPAAAAAATGTVLIETRPAGATVSIDGRVVGKAPMRVPELAPGPHTIQVDLAGHKSVTTTVVVRAGQQTPVRVSLEIR